MENNNENDNNDKEEDVIEKIGPIVLDTAIRLSKLEEILIKHNIIDREEYNKAVIEESNKFQGLIEQVLNRKESNG